MRTLPPISCLGYKNIRDKTRSFLLSTSCRQADNDNSSMMMTCPLVLLLTLGLATAATSSRQEFNNFKARFGKEYATPQEEEFRFRVFQVGLCTYLMIIITPQQAEVGNRKLLFSLSMTKQIFLKKYVRLNYFDFYGYFHKNGCNVIIKKSSVFSCENKMCKKC